MADLKFSYTRDRDPEKTGYHPEIPIPATLDRPQMLPPPEMTIVVEDKRKTTTK